MRSHELVKGECSYYPLILLSSPKGPLPEGIPLGLGLTPTACTELFCIRLIHIYLHTLKSEVWITPPNPTQKML
jgi:hypothetical protein